jgi:hypothetical protein
VKLALRHHNEPRLVYNRAATHQAPRVEACFLDDIFVMLGWLRELCLNYPAQSAIGCLSICSPEAMVKLQ